MMEGGGKMENPELEFLQWLLMRFVREEGLDVDKMSLNDLIDRLNRALTPLGGG
jgi:hypothetical protein